MDRLKSENATLTEATQSSIMTDPLLPVRPSLIEAMIALALFIIAAFGAWALHGPQIKKTTEDMVQFYNQPSEGENKPASIQP